MGYCPLIAWRTDRARLCNSARRLKRETNSWYSARSSGLRLPSVHRSANLSMRSWVSSSARTARIARAASGVSALPIGSTSRSRSVDECVGAFYEIGHRQGYGFQRKEEAVGFNSRVGNPETGSPKLRTFQAARCRLFVNWLESGVPKHCATSQDLSTGFCCETFPQLFP